MFEVGPLEDKTGNTRIFNGRGIKYALQFSVHARRYYSSLPVPETKFKGSEGGKVGAVSCNPRSSS